MISTMTAVAKAIKMYVISWLLRAPAAKPRALSVLALPSDSVLRH